MMEVERRRRYVHGIPSLEAVLAHCRLFRPQTPENIIRSFAERYFMHLKFLQENVPDFTPEELAKACDDFAVHYRKRNGTNVTKTFTGIHNDMRFYRDARRTLIQQETANQSQK